MNTNRENYEECIKKCRELMNELWNQIEVMLIYDMEFRALRAVVLEDPGSAIYNNILSELITIGYLNSMPLMVRRLIDDSSESVISLPRLIKEMSKNLELLSRNLPGGCLPERVVAKLKSWLKTKEVKKTKVWANKAVAHLEDSTNHSKIELTLEHVEKAQRQIVRVAQGITYILGEKMRNLLVRPHYPVQGLEMLFSDPEAKDHVADLMRKIAKDRDQWIVGVIEELTTDC
ncbi:hypothetical protein EM20IM_06095 [Candidatus Methylacidiphilum infernorum]|uniref:HEPN AbiU2-like domain-containing protein n=1 Tax=Candidatus Methylacidiphilum infernorum TaxID=511746 RepID=A0ABX7PT43_9BACT|nr:hypothetical protein [Candidatus Methylacidiphilum infernorum]QSR86082.1 hypothetical protein EM20IM_06095 [Candidatus Methylacidiphilum infernorum]